MICGVVVCWLLVQKIHQGSCGIQMGFWETYQSGCWEVGWVGLLDQAVMVISGVGLEWARKGAPFLLT